MKTFINTALILLSVMTIAGCTGDGSGKIWSSGTYAVYGDRVEQGGYKAVAAGDTLITSDYQSPANEFFNPEISFKFSINGRDNEAPSGMDHRVTLIRPDSGVQVVRCLFGAKDIPAAAVKGKNGTLPANTPVVFEVDMRSVKEAFDRQGYYTDFSGNRLYESDFKGVWIAGGTTPMSWDFENLPGRSDLQLTDPDNDGIYSCQLVFNAYDPARHTTAVREMTQDLSDYPSLESPFMLVNALYRMSLEDMLLDIRPDTTFRAGKQWDGVWTRDISYSIILSLAAIEPGISRNSLMRKVKNGLIIQDTGSGGSWPVSTDRVVWALAAWEVYKSTGDRQWLEEAYKIISASIDNDLKVAFNPTTGLFYGESSFLDWRKQTYPLWMEPIDIYRSHNLGTNALFCETLTLLDEMGEILDTDNDYGSRAAALKEAINSQMWHDARGYYGQYMYGHYDYSLSPRSESLGEALCILFNIASDGQKERMFTSVPVMEYGIPCIYPQIPGIPPYHNNASWPFVQGYWSWAAARNSNSAAVEHGIAAICRQAALFLTNKENMVAGNGDFNGTEINSDNQLWSVAANLAVIYRMIFGLDYQSGKLLFHPCIPKNFKGVYALKGLRYRDAMLDITITGFGDGITSFTIDGKPCDDPAIPASLAGEHTVSIMMNGRCEKGSVNMAGETFSPATPVAVIDGEMLLWRKADGAERYNISCNGTIISTTTDTIYDMNRVRGEYQVMAVGSDGTESFLSRPLRYGFGEDDIIIEAEQYVRASGKKVSGFSGRGFVEIDRESPAFEFVVSAPDDGDYVIEFRYSNGYGPVNTDNKCAQRSLFCNDAYCGTAIFPQRGGDEWSDWGMSNPLTVHLKKGQNRLELRLEEYNNNMNVNINGFLLDNVRVSRKIIK